MEDVEVKISPNDKRQYKRLVLENGLQVLLIHDSEISSQSAAEQQHETASDAMSVESDDSDAEGASKKAAVAMSVGVGSFSDPENMQGMAHYLEHMLFMGSEKFPDENEYDEYVQQNGGFTNAFTDMECTVYYFKVDGGALHGALDRFAQFFVAPLCLEDSLDREVLAVDSEFALALQDDSWRLQGLMQNSAKEGHIYRTFHNGNRASLKDEPVSKGIHIREELLKFYKSHYSAERMRLAVLGGASLEEMQSWVVSLFSAVACGLGPSISFKGMEGPFEGQVFRVMPSVNRMHNICVSFQYPSLTSEYKKKAEKYISHLIGHEGPGSLLSELKRRSWVVELTAGVEEDNFSASSCAYIFEVSMMLTEAGLRAEPGYGLAPVMLLFKYIEMLRDQGPQQWIYDELESMENIKVKFLEEIDCSNYVAELCVNMLHVQPGDEVLCEHMFEDWDPALIHELVCSMHPLASGLRIDFQTHEYDSIASSMTNGSTNGRSVFSAVQQGHHPRYDFSYLESQLHPDFLKSVAEHPSVKELKLPPKNPYIPRDFTLRTDPEQSAAHSPLYVKPDLLIDETGLRLWHKVDSLHKTPKTSAFFQLSGPVVAETGRPQFHATPKAAACCDLIVSVLGDVLTEESYMASMARLDCSVHQNLMGIEFHFLGFSEKLPLLIKSVFRRFTDLKIVERVFQTQKEELVRTYENENKKVQQHAQYLRVHTLTPADWHVDEVLKELRLLTLDDLQMYWRSILKDVFIEGLIYGNVTSQEAMELSKDIRQMIGISTLQATHRQLPRCLRLLPNCQIIMYNYRAPSKNPQEQNSALEAYFQCDQDDLTLRAKLDLIEQVCDEPCFNILRTKEQLGYLVHSRLCLTYGVLGFAVSIVSERFPPNHLEARVEEFLKSFEKTMMEMPTEEFEKHRKALIATKLEKDKNLKETAKKTWHHIRMHRYDFDAKQQEVQTLKHLTKADLLECYAQYLSPTNTGRKKLSVCITCPSHAEKPEASSLPEAYQKIEQLNTIRAAYETFPESSVILN